MRAPQTQPQARTSGRSGARPDVVQVAKAAGDELRSGILRVLADDAFGVLELGEIFGMAQPAISHHLKILSTAGLVHKRRESTSVFYHRAPPLGDDLVAALFAAIDARPVPAALDRGIESVYAARAARSREFFASHADILDTQSELVCPSGVYAPTVVETVLSTAPARGAALEIGPGSGELMLALAAHFEDVVGIDSSERMLEHTAATVAGQDNVDLVNEDFFELARGVGYDAVIAAMVLHHMPSPARFFARAAEVLRPRGTLVVAELSTHAQDWVRDKCGDLWLGFETAALDDWAAAAGLGAGQHQFLAQRNGFRVRIDQYCAP